MRTFFTFISFICLIGLLSADTANAQCSATASTTISSSWNANFTSISASGTGVTSTISVTASACTSSFSGCSTTYTNLYSSQGITAPTGSTISIPVTKAGGYVSYYFVYVDWNNDGNYTSSEQVGSTITWGTSGATVTNTFTIPLTGIVTNTNLHMRVFNAETYGSGYIAPCSAVYGDTYDFYLNATCTTPTITTSISSAIICGSGSLAVTASSTVSGTSYAWSPAAGLSTTSGAAVTVSPTITTTYTILGYGPGVCEASTTLPITYTAAGPTPTITPSGSTTFCSGGNVTLTETSGAGVSFQWYNGSTAIAGATNSTFFANPSATTTYQVTITTSAGCTSSSSVTVTVLPTPTAAITPVGATTVCSSNSVRLNASPTGGGVSYRWFDGGSIITGATANNLNASVTGNYAVEVLSPFGCRDTSTITVVTVNPKPSATATSTAPFTVCDNDSVVLTAGAGFTSFQWMDGLTPIAGATNRSYAASTPGTFNYRVQVGNGFGCLDTTGSGLFRVTVIDLPSSTIAASGPVTFCSGGNVTLSVASGNAYQWYTGATAASLSLISGATASSIVVATTGYYAVRATNAFGCTTNSLAAPILVTSVTAPTVVSRSPTTFCWGGGVTLYASVSSGATGVVYQWKRNTTNIAGATSSSYSATSSGDYCVYVNIAGSCVSTTAPISVFSNPLPNPIVTYSDGKVSTSNTFATYQWYKTNTLIPGATSWFTPIYDTGSYKVKVTDGSGCQSMSPSLPVTTLGINEVYGQLQVDIYPNPATNNITINAPALVKAIFTTADGKLVLETTNEHDIDLSNFANGLYIVTLYDTTGKRVYTGKVVKQ